MAAAKEGKWSCLLCNVPAAMVGAFLPTPNFDMGDCCAAIYGSCGVCMGPAGHEVGIPPELLRRIEESLRLLSEGEGTEAPVQ
jgi:hypothetical protein